MMLYCLLTQCHYHQGTCLNAIRRFGLCSLWSHLNVLTFSPWLGGAQEVQMRSDFALNRQTGSSRRLYAGGGSYSQYLWRAWRMRDCRNAWCSENNWWGTRAAWGGRKKSGYGVSWTTSEHSASSPTSSSSGWLQPRTRRDGARRRDKGRNV